jgi:hypothetical protein
MDRSDLIAEAVAGACAAVVVAIVLDKSEVVKKAATRVPRLGWKADDEENPPILARLLGTLVATIVFRSTFSVARNTAKALMDGHGPETGGLGLGRVGRWADRLPLGRSERSPSDDAPPLAAA